MLTSLWAGESDFAGTISVAETIAGDQTSGKDQEELSRYAALVEARDRKSVV